MTDLATTAEARRRADVIRMGMVAYDQTLRAIAEAYAARDWETLGYTDWNSYIAEEFSEARVRLNPEQRAQAVSALRIEGMSQRAIASALGVGQATVRRDLSGEPNDSPEAKVTGIDGKAYAPKSAPQRPISEPVTQPDADEILAQLDERTVSRIKQANDIADSYRSLREDLQAIPPERMAEIEESVRPAVQFRQLVSVCSFFVERLALVDLSYAARGLDPSKATPIQEAIDRLNALRETLGAMA